MDKKSLSHTAWKCQYHVVFIPKYRKKKLYGQVRTDVRDIIKTLCNYKGVEIIEGGSVHRSCASVCQYSAQNERVRVYGIPEGEKCPDDF